VSKIDLLSSVLSHVPLLPLNIFSDLFFHSLLLSLPSPLHLPFTFHPTAPTSSILTTLWLVYCINPTHYPIHLIPLQSLTQAPSPTITDLHPSTHKDPNTL
jgi:hypothetical protein